MPTNDDRYRKDQERAKKAREAREQEVIDAAAELDPKDQSPKAQQLRETAEDIQDHRDNPGGQ